MRTIRTAEHGTRRSRNGAAAVELAISLPLLLLLAFGCVDLGRGIATYIAVSNAARTGAEYGATHGFTDYSKSSWESEVSSRSREEMQGVSSFDASRFSTTVDAVPVSSSVNLIRVTVNYRFETLTSWTGLQRETVITRTVGIRRFR